MELMIDIKVDQIIGLIKQLSTEYKQKIKKELDMENIAINSFKNENGLTELLLSGPVMNYEEKKNFKNMQKYFDKWTKKAFA